MSLLTDERCLEGAGAKLARTGAVALAALLFPTGAEGQGGGTGDRQVLEALYHATDGPGWTDSTNWLTDAPLSAWFGVTTDDDGRVEALELRGNGLSGPIPAEVGQLSRLMGLGLGSRWDSALEQQIENELTGPIPPSLGRLSNLRWLLLNDNDLTGAIPDALGDLANLEWLGLSGNGLTGPIPFSLGRLSNLSGLRLSSNDLTGRIPDALGDLANLEFLDLGWNGLTGPIPSSLGRLSNLRSLNLYSNELTGRIPDALGDLANLEFLDLGWNELTGQIPDALGDLANLEFLTLGWNGLTGPIPSWLGRLSNLRRLDLESTDLTGAIPHALGNLANLEELRFILNQLVGPLPPALTQLSRLTLLDIRFTDLCVPANPVFQEWLASIEDFRGSTCNRPPEAVGTIPAQTLTANGASAVVPVADYFSDPDEDPLTYAATSSRGSTVTTVASGDTAWLVPRAAGTATVTVTAQDPGGLSVTQTVAVTTVESPGPQTDREVLEVLYDATGGASWTDSTNWNTAVPLEEWYGVATDGSGRVTGLELTSNGLRGPLPDALSHLADLESLGLADNALTGPISSSLGRLSNLRELSLWRNELTGRIPDALGNLANLESLSLDGNRLTGPVPSSLGRLSNLRELSLSRNELTGRIPGALSDLANLRSLGLDINGLTGPIPSSFGRLSNLEELRLYGNELTGRIPDGLGDLANLRLLSLGDNGLTGPIPSSFGRPSNLQRLDLSYNWGLSGPLPSGLNLSIFEGLDILVTQACAPAAWQERLATIEFTGRLCETGTDVTIDVAVVYTPAAREEAGGTAAIEAVIDLMVAETNEAYEASGVRPRLALVARSEVQYTEAGDRDVDRFLDPSDGYMDEVHAMRDRAGADLLHLVFKRQDHTFAGIAQLPGAFGLTCQHCGGHVFAHELGHNMGLRHDRYVVHHHEGGVSPDPAYGYVNQQTFVAGSGATRSSRWFTIMSYPTQCEDAYKDCTWLLRFSNPRQTVGGDPLGVAFGGDAAGVTGPADAAAVLNATGPAVALWRDHVPRPNRPPEAAGALADRRLTGLSSTLAVDVSRAFADPDGDALTYGASSSAPRVAAAVAAAGARVTVTAVGEGTASVTVTATDPGGLSASQSFAVTVTAGNRAPEPVGTLAPLTLEAGEAPVSVDVSGAFADPDGDGLSYGVSSSAPQVATVAAAGARVTVTAVGEGTATVTVTATDPGGLSATQSFAVTVTAGNRAPEPAGALEALTLEGGDTPVSVDVSRAFADPDGDALTYGASSSAPRVATVAAAGARVTVTAVGEGTASVTVTATDPGGLSAAQSFGVRVTAPFTDDPIQPGVTPVRAVHFTELRERIDALREEAGLGRFAWTDPFVRAGVTRVRLVHVLELRQALGAAYTAAGRAAPRWTDPSPVGGATPIRAAHLTELRAAVVGLE